MDKHDFSELSHKKPRKRPSLFGPVNDALITLGGAHPGTARSVSSEDEILALKMLGLVLLLASCMTAATVTSVLHFAAGDGRFHISYLFVGLLVGALQGCSDNILRYRMKFVERGGDFVAVAGTQLPGLIRAGLEILILNFVRLLQSGAIALLAALSIILMALGSSIGTFNDNRFRQENPAAYVEMTRQIDAAIKSTTDDLASSTGRVEQLNKMLLNLRQENMRRSVKGRATVGPASLAPDLQIEKLENALTVESANRDALKATLTKQVANREPDIERKIAVSPNVTPKPTGLSGQLAAVSAMAGDDWKLLAIVFMLAIVSCAVELSPAWITLLFFPAGYATYIATERFLTARKAAKHCAKQLTEGETSDSRSLDAEASIFGTDPTKTFTQTGFEPLSDLKEAAPPVPLSPSSDVVALTSSNEGHVEAPVTSELPDATSFNGNTPAQESIAEALGLRPRKRRPTNTEQASRTNGVDHD
jgi:hypothetical protein